MSFCTLTMTTTKLGVNFPGILYVLFLVVFIIASLPLYLVRVVVICLAKAFRSSDIFNGKSSMFLGDYFAESNPRSNVIITMILEGSLTIEDVQTLVLRNWIGADGYANLQRYPVKWVGWGFWRKLPKPFQIHDYVHKFSGKETQVTDDTLSDFIETLLNKRLPKNHSPWELHLIENYEYSENGNRTFSKPHSVLILKWHHCLMDGTGAFTALIEGLFKQQWVRKRESQPPSKTLSQNILHVLAFPINAFLESVKFLSPTFQNSAFKVSNDRREWHQVYATSGIIPNQLIKDIKNAFDVSYTSVLLSAISAAAYKTQLEQSSWSVPLLSVLPAMGTVNRKVLANHFTATTVHLPTVCYSNPIERLVAVDKLFEKSRLSAQPTVIHYCIKLACDHFCAVTEFFTKNRMFSIGLTNFAGPQGNVQVNENSKWIHSKTIVGGLSGSTGIAISTYSHGHNTEINVTAERALMSRKQAQEFIHHIEEELDVLGDLMPKYKSRLKNELF